MRPLIFFLGGAAALSWQIIWQHHVVLAIGASAQAVALTIATAMVGMTIGAVWCGARLRSRTIDRPMLLYGCLELAIGLSAHLPALSRSWLAKADAAVYQQMPGLATPFTLLALVLTIGPASVVMGATVPVIGLAAKQVNGLLSRFYGFNTAGAAIGALAVGFVLIPNLGMLDSALTLTGIHVVLALACFRLGMKTAKAGAGPGEEAETSVADLSGSPALPQRVAWTFAFATGFASFMLEVAWFRSLRAAWLSTTDTFAVLLFCFLVALAVGALIAPRVRRIGLSLPAVLAVASVLVLLVTPVIERFDLISFFGGNYRMQAASRVLAGLLVMGPPIAMIGVSLPALLDEVRGPRQWGILYGWNTLGAVLGSIGAAWVFLPLLGFAPTAWLAGGILALTALWQFPTLRSRFEPGLFIAAALAVAIWANSGVGKSRAQGTGRFFSVKHRFLTSVNGPDVTTAIVEFEGGRVLFIDGFPATAQFDSKRASYMDGMGRLPMLLHPDPRDALVICFGTGQTAHAVRDEGPERLTLVDLNPAVFQLSNYFDANHQVIEDPRIRTRVMDGRAWLRRSQDRYDVVTLEPMPPFFAGSNALYSVEFYREIAARLKPGGIVAQWFPLHLMTPEHAQAIAAAFVEVVPNAILWIDPHSVGSMGIPEQAILIGRIGGEDSESEGAVEFWNDWPGFSRIPGSVSRPLSEDQVREYVILKPEHLARYVDGATPVTDDNQRLAYGADIRPAKKGVSEMMLKIVEQLNQAATGKRGG